MRKIVMMIVVVMLTGCADSTGWRFEVGISPVKSLTNTAGLKQEEPKRERY